MFSSARARSFSNSTVSVHRAGFGFGSELGYDDIMNLTFSWTPPLHTLLASLLLPFTSFYPKNAPIRVATTAELRAFFIHKTPMLTPSQQSHTDSYETGKE